MAGKLSYDSQIYLLMLGQFLHVFSLNEIVDIPKIYAKELSRIRGITLFELFPFWKLLLLLTTKDTKKILKKCDRP